MKPREAEQAEIKQRIERALRRDPRVSAEPIEVEVQTKSVLLHGVVQSARRKLAAGEIAAGLAGLPIRNQLQVNMPVCAPDEELVERIYAALERHPNGQSETVAARVKAGRAELFGVVGSEAVSRSLENLTMAVPGVRSVENRLQINAVRALRDKNLARQATHALGEHALEASVVVADGAAIVRPLIEPLDEKQRYADILAQLGLKPADWIAA